MQDDADRFVFDASAILAALYRESGYGRVVELLDGGAVNAVNLAEVATKLHEDANPPDEVEENIRALGLTVVPFTDRLALLAAELRNPTKHVGLSLGDRACLATALHLGLPAVTTDRVWTKLELGIPIHVVR